MQRSAALRGCNSKSRRPLAVGVKEEVRPRHHHRHRRTLQKERKPSVHRRPVAISHYARTFSRIRLTFAFQHKVRRSHIRTDSPSSLHSHRLAVAAVPTAAKPTAAAEEVAVGQAVIDPSPSCGDYVKDAAQGLITTRQQSHSRLVQTVAIGVEETTVGQGVVRIHLVLTH